MTAQTECYQCRHRRNIPGDCHISCAKPHVSVFENAAPHGFFQGWFFYPYNFDPVWKQSLCPNFVSIANPNQAKPQVRQVNVQEERRND